MIIIDAREQKLIELIKSTKYSTYADQYNVKGLDLGDIHITGADDQVLCIIERKTVPDLVASIIDGRYREQKSRLVQSNTKIVYVIEGKIENKRKSLPETTIWSALIHTMIRDNCNVFRTTDLDDTATFIFQLHKCFEKGMNSKNGKMKNISTNVPFQTASMVSKRNVRSDPQVIYHCQLRAIPGVSDAIAATIREKWTTLSELINFVRSEDNSVDVLKDMLPENSKRKIGPVVAKRVVSSFM